MNRTRLPMPKLISKISCICMLLLLPLLTKAFPPVIKIKTCYQTVSFDYVTGSPSNFKLLDFGGAPIMSYAAYGGGFRYFAIRQYQPTSSSFEYVDFSADHTAIPISGGITIYENTTPTITLPTSGSIIFDFYNDPLDPPVSTTIDFIGADEAFKILPYNQSCFTYDNFKIKNDLTDLQGFCGVTGNYQLKSIGGTMGLPTNFSMNIDMGQTSASSVPVQVPINQSECAEYSCAASPAPCRCMDFNFEFKLYPCTGTTIPNCPTEILISKPIKLCCNCGYQEPELPTMGKNTAGTALTGENSVLTIFPNPNQSGKLQVNTSGNSIKNIKIYAVDGKLVKNITVKEVLNQVSVDISNLQPGIYQVKVLDNVDAVSNKKLVVE